MLDLTMQVCAGEITNPTAPRCAIVGHGNAHTGTRRARTYPCEQPSTTDDHDRALEGRGVQGLRPVDLGPSVSGSLPRSQGSTRSQRSHGTTTRTVTPRPGATRRLQHRPKAPSPHPSSFPVFGRCRRSSRKTGFQSSRRRHLAWQPG